MFKLANDAIFNNKNNSFNKGSIIVLLHQKQNVDVGFNFLEKKRVYQTI